MPFADAINGARASASQLSDLFEVVSRSTSKFIILHACVYDGLEDNYAGRQKWPEISESICSKGVVYLTFW